jgi:RHS repeat-associated protein
VFYYYDGAGNRTSVVDTVLGNATYTPNDFNQYSAVTASTITNGSEHEISSYQGPYDAELATYAYINDEHLKSVTSASNSYYLSYDALGRCVKRTLNGVTTYCVYDGQKPILEYPANDLTHPAKNLYGKGVDEILMRTDPTVNGGAAFCYQQDHEGSVTHLTNAAGTKIERYRYDVFGLPIVYDGNDNRRPNGTAYKNRFLFTGREYAATFGFYEYRARAYHPLLGRFMSEDHKLADTGDYNLFRYCHNDPIDFTDPMGLGIDNPPPPVAQWTVSALKWDIASRIPHWVPVATLTGQNLNSLTSSQLSQVMRSLTMAQIGMHIASSSAASTVNPTQVRIIDREDSFSPSEWSDRPYNLQWSLRHDGNTVNSGAVNGITPRQAYAQSGQIGFATAAGMTPGQSVTYNLVRYTSAGFVRSGWSVSATVIDPWGIQRGALQTRIGLQNSGVIPAGVNLRAGGGLSSFLYGQLPASLQYNGYYYATGGY